MESELRPRLCFLTKGESGYGFHLHSERNRGGQFIRKIEPGSSAELSGLQPGDRLVEVNGENVENESHHQVVERILAVGHRTRLLVVDRGTDDHLHRHGLACTEDLAVEMGNLSTRPSPRSTPSASPLPRENGTISAQHILKQLLKARNSPSHSRCLTYSPLPTRRANKLPPETDTEITRPSPRTSPSACLRSSPLASPRTSPTACLSSSPLASPRPSPSASPRPSPTACLRSSPSASPRPSPTACLRSSPLASPRPSPTACLRSSPSASPRPSPLPRENGTISAQHILKQLLRARNSPSPSRCLTYSPLLTRRANKLPPETDTETSAKQPLKLPEEKPVVERVEEPVEEEAVEEEAVVERVPHLYRLVKGKRGYGFDLHSDKTRRRQCVLSLDPRTAAHGAGVRTGDRLVEVNRVSVGGLRHSGVVELIRAGGEEVSLLVVDQETDYLFQKLGITPTSSHVADVYVYESPLTESAVPTPSPTSELPATDPPVVSLTPADSPVTNGSSMSRTNGSSASQSSIGSTTLSEFSSSDMSIQIPDEDESQGSDSFFESGLRLSPTAAEAKKKACSKRNKKRAPPMDWSKRQEIFSNL